MSERSLPTHPAMLPGPIQAVVLLLRFLGLVVILIYTVHTIMFLQRNFNAVVDAERQAFALLNQGV